MEEEWRRIARWFLPILAATAAVALLGAVVALTYAPASDDLYQLLYGPIRPNKPESTAVFLLIFPGFLSAGTLAVWLQLHTTLFRPRRPWRMPLEAQRALMVAWAAAFLLGALYRDAVVIHRFW